ncbi:NAD-dependent epimerase/dehydratase family protein [Paraburkholderia sp. UCT31]|uniref:NAD-dependent epimerase/dehydratase family protein n=1 Tax=Paraburkholderia sp. UCT31 TaxID=2615209 RepID=UPI0016560ED5|nr:NAD-dependent epimerase/dehydratase family protein [Paraburkholderia sp. UCT31]MBC8737316.1 NAD-dependent epimerase/dehydratase family protein [Paraburkholderia sp. UCT31]
MKYLITGVAGFIGFHLAKRLLAEGHRVVGVDSLNDYYDVGLKHARLRILEQFCDTGRYCFVRGNLADREMASSLAEGCPDIIVHLAAQAGVRYSLENPRAYSESNIEGFLTILEVARRVRPRHLLYASSSSVYGSSSPVPFTETALADKPDSFYAATKRANELMGHSYAHLYGIPATALRFFTVYGPWGRPDMAMYKFALAMRAGKPIPVFGDGSMRRDFTYIDDCVRAVTILANKAPDGEDPHRIVNVGNRRPESVSTLISLLEQSLRLNPTLEHRPVPPGDVPITYANTELLESLTGFSPSTPLSEGVAKFCEWFESYHGSFEPALAGRNDSDAVVGQAVQPHGRRLLEGDRRVQVLQAEGNR